MKKYLCVLAAILLLLMCGCSSTTQDNTAVQSSEEVLPTEQTTQVVRSEDYPTITEISYGFFDYQMFDEYLNDGVYRCGTDFEPGEYYIFSLYNAACQYKVCDNPNDFSWSHYRVIYKVSVDSGQYVQLSNEALLVAATDVDESNWTQYGVYLVGVDIPAGDYKVTTLEDRYYSELGNISGVRGAYQISDNSPVDDQADASVLFDDQTYISVEDGQYVAIVNAKMEYVGESAN